MNGNRGYPCIGRWKHGLAIGCILALAGGGAVSAQTSNTPEHSFADGENITILLPVPPGGGYDSQSRLLAPYFQEKLREISGVDVNVRVESMPGGGHLVAMQHVQNMEPDGRTFGYFSIGISTAHRVFHGEDLDPRQYTPLGSLLRSTRGFLSRTDFEVPRDLEALAARSQEVPILMGHTGTDANLKIAFGIWSANGLDIDVDYVELDGSSGTVASLLRDEIELGHATASGYKRFIDDNPDDLELYIFGGCERHSLFPDVPTVVDLGAPEAELVCDVLFSDYRTFLAPGGIPEGDAAVLSEALHEAIHDPEFAEKFEDAFGEETTWIDPERIKPYIEQFVSTWEENAHYAQD